jgi:sucrose-6-phosphate hydrolase SacC (GH32 family)
MEKYSTVMLDGIISYWTFDEGEGNKTFNAATGKSCEISYVFNNAKYKPSSDPVWLQGVKGSALLFDGFSTWIEDSKGIFDKEIKCMSIEVWAAPRCHEYNEDNNITAIVNQQNEDKAEGFVLGFRKFGVISFKVSVQGRWYELTCEESPIPLNEWTHITGVFNGTKGYIELYANGNKIGSSEVPGESTLSPCSETLMIGRSNNALKLEGVYEVGCYCGLLDELKIYDKALSSREIIGSYSGCLNLLGGKLPQPDLTIDRTVFEGDRHRPVYHFISPGYWMNEPHGPMFFNGQYHLFFQHNPHGPLWRQIHWGHVVSEDMVHWRDVPCALVPGINEIDSKGDWSGCAIVDDGVPTIIYTAGDGPVYSQCTAIARSTFKEDGDNDLKNWVKSQIPVILQEKNIETEKGQAYFGQFRDPFVWKEEDTYYAVIGSGIHKDGISIGGTALMYSSKDLNNWKYEKPLYIGDYKAYPKTGEVWELPVFLPIGKDETGNMKHILLINPWFFSYSPYNVKYVWYWVGNWDRNTLTFTPDSDKPELLDVGEHFTGPSGMIDPKGRTIIFSIAQGRRSSQDEVLSGWAHNGGLPVNIYMRPDGRVGIEPIQELQSLRARKYIDIEDISMEEANIKLSLVKDDCIEIQLEMDGGRAEEFGIKLKRTPAGEEETLLYYKKSTKEILIDKNKSTLDSKLTKGIQGGVVNIGEDILKLHIYLDKSMIEAYANGLKGLTSRAYPTKEDALGLLLWADSNYETVRVKSLKVWKLNSAYKNLTSEGDWK